MSEMSRMQGVVKWYSVVKHFGYLLTINRNQEVFFHINDCSDFVPEEMMRVEFEYGHDRKGRVKAIRINRVSVGGYNDNSQPICCKRNPTQ